MLRAANSMLRSLGKDTVSLVFPQVGMPDDPSAQLGLVDPERKQMEFTPVIVRSLPTSNSGPRRRLEITPAGDIVADDGGAQRGFGGCSVR